MDREVFLSLLALDSYNRGYGQNVLLNTGDESDGQNEIGRQLGTATILRDANDPEGVAQAAGFYAIAYDWNGETIISYRGTDNLADLFTGWTIGAGFDDASQAGLSTEFYGAVRGTIDPSQAGLSIFEGNVANDTWPMGLAA